MNGNYKSEVYLRVNGEKTRSNKRKLNLRHHIVENPCVISIIGQELHIYTPSMDYRGKTNNFSHTNSGWGVTSKTFPELEIGYYAIIEEKSTENYLIFDISEKIYPPKPDGLDNKISNAILFLKVNGYVVTKIEDNQGDFILPNQL